MATKQRNNGSGENEAKRRVKTSKIAFASTEKSLKAAQEAVKAAEDDFKVKEDASKTAKSKLEAAQKEFDAAQDAAKMSMNKLTTARKARDVAKEEHRDVEAEMKDAEAYLEANKKRKVVDQIEEDGDKANSESSASKQIKVESGIKLVAQSKNRKIEHMGEPESENVNLVEKTKKEEYIIVNGSGVSKVDGIYKRGGDIQGVPCYRNNEMGSMLFLTPSIGTLGFLEVVRSVPITKLLACQAWCPLILDGK